MNHPERETNTFLMPSPIRKDPRLFRVQLLREAAIAAGLWVMERFTICGGCDRYTFTTRERLCRRCFERVEEGRALIDEGRVPHDAQRA